MKNLLESGGIPSIIYFVIILGFTSFIGSSNINNSNGVPAGTVIYSMLPPEVFLIENGKENWMLMNGQALNFDSKLMKTVKKYKLQGILKENRLPDARGQFIRSMNHLGGLDPEQRTVGYRQPALTSLPKETKFKLSKGVANLTTVELAILDNMKSVAGTATQGKNKAKDGHIVVANINYGRTFASGGGSTLLNRTRAQTEIVGGDKETRPTNIALYTYIKIN